MPTNPSDGALAAAMTAVARDIALLRHHVQALQPHRDALAAKGRAEFDGAVAALDGVHASFGRLVELIEDLDADRFPRRFGLIVRGGLELSQEPERALRSVLSRLVASLIHELLSSEVVVDTGDKVQVVTSGGYACATVLERGTLESALVEFILELTGEAWKGRIRLLAQLTIDTDLWILSPATSLHGRREADEPST